jgi:hypothetical protein
LVNYPAVINHGGTGTLDVMGILQSASAVQTILR